MKINVNVVTVWRGCPTTSTGAKNLVNEGVVQHQVIYMTMRAVSDLAGGVLVMYSLKNRLGHNHVPDAA
jgi:hypothetical protein